MKRTVWLTIVIVLVALATLSPRTVAFARGEDSDNGCPPRAQQGIEHASALALEITTPINPPANANAWAKTNPGNK